MSSAVEGSLTCAGSNSRAVTAPYVLRFDFIPWWWCWADDPTYAELNTSHARRGSLRVFDISQTKRVKKKKEEEEGKSIWNKVFRGRAGKSAKWGELCGGERKKNQWDEREKPQKSNMGLCSSAATTWKTRRCSATFCQSGVMRENKRGWRKGFMGECAAAHCWMFKASAELKKTKQKKPLKVAAWASAKLAVQSKCYLGCCWRRCLEFGEVKKMKRKEKVTFLHLYMCWNLFGVVDHYLPSPASRASWPSF